MTGALEANQNWFFGEYIRGCGMVVDSSGITAEHGVLDLYSAERTARYCLVS